MVTPEGFRQQFPMFFDPDIYSDGVINSWITTAGIFLNADRWAEALDFGTSLYIAHNLTLAERDMRAAMVGGIPGALQGILTAKAVDKASASYDANSVAQENAGEYNLTRFGIQFIKLARAIGSGGMQVGPTSYPFGPVDGWLGFGGGFWYGD